jgi:ankyrin repeat protein
MTTGRTSDTTTTATSTTVKPPVASVLKRYIVFPGPNLPIPSKIPHDINVTIKSKTKTKKPTPLKPVTYGKPSKKEEEMESTKYDIMEYPTDMASTSNGANNHQHEKSKLSTNQTSTSTDKMLLNQSITLMDPIGSPGIVINTPTKVDEETPMTYHNKINSQLQTNQKINTNTPILFNQSVTLMDPIMSSEKVDNTDSLDHHDEINAPLHNEQKNTNTTIPFNQSVTLMDPSAWYGRVDNSTPTNDRDGSHYQLRTEPKMTDRICLDQSVTLIDPNVFPLGNNITGPIDLTSKEVQQWNEFFLSIIETGDLDSVKQCIEMGCIDLEQTKTIDDAVDGFYDEYTALQLACLYDHYEMVRYFIEVAGMDASIQSRQYGSTILHIATRVGAVKLLQYLIDSDMAIIDIESVDNDGKTAMHWACQLGLYDIVSYLIECGPAKFLVQDKNGNTPLQLASRNGHLNVVKYLMEQYQDADVAYNAPRAYESDLHASFWLACRYGQFPIVQYMIHEDKIHVNFQNESDGMTALLFACQYGALSFVQFLCEDCRADVHILDKLGESALDKARTYEHDNVVAYLSERQLKILKIAEEFRNAAKFGNLSAVIDCISNNDDVNIDAGGSTGKTALHYSIANGHYGVVHYLVQQCGANIHQCTVDGATPLHYACRYGQLKCVQLLCRKGCPTPNANAAYLNRTDNQNETALDKAKKYGHNDIVEFFEMFITN